MFFSYPWNNFLHATVEQIVRAILEGQNDDMKVYILTTCKLLDRLADAAKRNQEECSKPKGTGLGYMGHVTLIATHILNAVTISPSIQDILTANEQWGDFVKGPLTAIRERETRSFAG